jgi:ornithine carbamoyltransferase
MVRHLLKITDFTKEECLNIIDKSIEIKANIDAHASDLKDKTLLMLFEKPSLRTRVSFEVGMTQLGGHGIFYSIKDSPLGKKENIEDTAGCISRYADIMMARVFKKEDLVKLSEHSTIPVINALDDFAHPCQILCDFQTIKEKKGDLNPRKMTYFGDCHNNVTYDLMRLSALLGWEMAVCGPEGSEYEPEQAVLDEIAKISETSKANIYVSHDAQAAAKDADVIYTDSWMSYGIPEKEEQKRVETFKPYQVTTELVNLAQDDVIFMNCLPAKRGYEQAADVIDGSKSIVFDQAENRLHIQKAIMLFLLDKL